MRMRGLALGLALGVVFAAVSAVGVGARVTDWVMSPDATVAFYEWNLAPVPAGTPTNTWFNFGAGSRRFTSQTVTWRAMKPLSMQAVNARRATRFWTEVVRIYGGAPSGFQFVEVDPADATAMLTFYYSTTSPYPAPYNAVNCATQVPFLAADGVSYERGYIISNPTRSGCDGDRLMMHEVGHYMTTMTSHPSVGIMSKAFYGCPQYNPKLTPEENAADPRWQGVPGLFEMAAWVASHKAGSFPP